SSAFVYDSRTSTPTSGENPPFLVCRQQRSAASPKRLTDGDGLALRSAIAGRVGGLVGAGVDGVRGVPEPEPGVGDGLDRAALALAFLGRFGADEADRRLFTGIEPFADEV